MKYYFLLLLIVIGVRGIGQEIYKEDTAFNGKSFAVTSDIFFADTSYIDKFIIAPCNYCRLIYVEGWLKNGVAYDRKGRKILQGWLKKAKIIEIK